MLAITAAVIGAVAMASTETMPLGSNYIILLPAGGYSIFGNFFIQLMVMIALLTLACIGVFNKHLRCVGWTILFFVGYKMGAIMVVVVTENTMLGVIYLLLHTLPINLCFIIIMSTMICHISHYLSTHGSYRRCSITCRGQLQVILRRLIISSIVMLAFAIIFMLIVPSVVKIFVVI